MYVHCECLQKSGQLACQKGKTNIASVIQFVPEHDYTSDKNQCKRYSAPKPPILLDLLHNTTDRGSLAPWRALCIFEIKLSFLVTVTTQSIINDDSLV